MKEFNLLVVMSLIITLSSAASARERDIVFPEDFFFGIANASAHVEDQLDDIWADFGRRGRVAAFLNTPIPYERLRFWTEPEVELDLAQELGVGVFRLGIDWERLAPVANDTGVVNRAALDHYKTIIRMARERGMKVMLTLFHHSEPKWTMARGSWYNPQMTEDFVRFSMASLEVLAEDVDYIAIFNEAQIYVAFTQITNMWPSPFRRPQTLGMFDLGPFKGNYTRSLQHVADAHIQIYDQVKQKYPHIMVGMAHNIGHHIGENIFHEIFAYLARERMNNHLQDALINHMDYIGVNFYGTEVVRGTNVIMSPHYQYSDSGRAISPTSFYATIKSLHERYNRSRTRKVLPFIITENGVADEADKLRGSYLLEHLAALRKMMSEGVPLLGYIHWTLSDNWEWADGYCPKFGLVAVDRTDGLKRIPRDSFYLYQEVIANRTITQKMRNEAWAKVQGYYAQGVRNFCRSADGVTGLDNPITVPLRRIDWRFRN